MNARSNDYPITIKFVLIVRYGDSWSTTIRIDTIKKDYRISLASLTPDSTLLLPRPYPRFQTLFFIPDVKRQFRFSNMEKMQLFVVEGGPDGKVDLDVEYIYANLQPNVKR